MDRRFGDVCAYVLMSYWLLNLLSERGKVFGYFFCVLTCGWWFVVSDVWVNKPVPEKLKQSPAAWSG